MAKYPLYELKKKDNSNFIEAIAIVDKPAIQSNFYMFADEEKRKYFFSDTPKKMIAGLALIPELRIYRNLKDDEGNITEEFEVFFSADTIAELRNDFMKNKRNDSVNFMHVDNAVPENTYMVESYIVESELQQKDLKQRFNIDAPLRSWFVQYYIEDLSLFNQIKEYGMHGFSIQGQFDTVLIHLNNNNKNNNNLMSKIIDKFKAVLQEMEAEIQVGLVDKIAETGETIKVGKVGEPVSIEKVDINGQPIESPCPNGEYVLENGDTVAVENGNLVSRTPKVEAPVVAPEELAAPAPEAEPKPAEAEPVEPQGKPASGETKTEMAIVPPVLPEVVAPEGEVVPEVVPPVDVKSKTLGDIIDMTKDGKTYIEVEVLGGEIVTATVEAEQDLVKATQLSAQLSIVESLNAEILALKAQLKLPVTTPIVNQKPQLFQADLAKMTPYEQIAVSKGLRVIN